MLRVEASVELAQAGRLREEPEAELRAVQKNEAVLAMAACRVAAGRRIDTD